MTLTKAQNENLVSTLGFLGTQMFYKDLIKSKNNIALQGGVKATLTCKKGFRAVMNLCLLNELFGFVLRLFGYDVLPSLVSYIIDIYSLGSLSFDLASSAYNNAYTFGLSFVNYFNGSTVEYKKNFQQPVEVPQANLTYAQTVFQAGNYVIENYVPGFVRRGFSKTIEEFTQSRTEIVQQKINERAWTVFFNDPQTQDLIVDIIKYSIPAGATLVVQTIASSKGRKNIAQGAKYIWETIVICILFLTNNLDSVLDLIAELLCILFRLVEKDPAQKTTNVTKPAKPAKPEISDTRITPSTAAELASKQISENIVNGVPPSNETVTTITNIVKTQLQEKSWSAIHSIRVLFGLLMAKETAKDTLPKVNVSSAPQALINSNLIQNITQDELDKLYVKQAKMTLLRNQYFRNDLIQYIEDETWDNYTQRTLPKLVEEFLYPSASFDALPVQEQIKRIKLYLNRYSITTFVEMNSTDTLPDGIVTNTTTVQELNRMIQ